MYLVQFIRGFCMALADSVPGVSGGTVAFLLGFYDQFIDSIDDLITGSREKKKAALFFLIKLGTGWVCGMILAILILASVFDAHIYAISSLFIGFIIFAIPIIFREEKNCLAAKKSAIPFVLIGVAIVTAIASAARAANTTRSPTAEIIRPSAKVISCPVHIYSPHLLHFVSFRNFSSSDIPYCGMHSIFFSAHMGTIYTAPTLLFYLCIFHNILG